MNDGQEKSSSTILISIGIKLYIRAYALKKVDINVEKALDVLSFSKQKGAVLIKKLLDSAISNAENNENADIDDLKIKSIVVNKGLVMKRIKIRARGRADRIRKPMCHIEIKLTNKEKEVKDGSES